MKINKNSWHYKLNDKFYVGVSFRSICTYFWGTVFSSFMVGVFFPVATLLILSTLLLPIITIFVPSLINTALVGAIVVGAIADVIILSHVINYALKKYRKKERKPTLVGEYISAKKQKVCPLVEYVDE